MLYNKYMNSIKKFLIVFMVVGFLISPVVLFADPNIVNDPLGSPDIVNDPLGSPDIVNDPLGSPNNNSSARINNPIGVDNLQDFIKALLDGVLRIAIPIIVLAIIYSGFLFVKARGNSTELETAKNALMYTLIGAAVLLGSWAIAQIVADTVLSL
jgi:hypothetical protein